MEIEALQEILREWPKERRYIEKCILLYFGAYFFILFGGVIMFVTIILWIANDMTLQPDSFIMAMAIMGGSALALGLWLSLTSRPISLLVLGIVFCVFGSVLASFYLKEMFQGEIVKPDHIAMNVIMVGLGVVSLLYYPSYKKAFRGRPGREMLKKIYELIKSIKKAKPSEVQDLIEFYISPHYRWKGKLLGEMAFLMAWSTDSILEDVNLLIIGKSDLNIKKLGGKLWLGEDLRASFQIGERRGEGSIFPEMMERYEAWKATEGTQGL